MGDDKVNLPSVNGIDPDLGITPTITPEEAEEKVSAILLVAAAKDPAVFKQLLQGVQEAKAAKMSAESILGIFEKSVGMALNILL